MNAVDIQTANAAIKTTSIKGKDYATVTERIKAFRSICPNGTITTEIITHTENMVVMVAKVYEGETLLATGTAYETKDSGLVNKTSYIENCETSAVGRALGFLGLGIDTSVASFEEMVGALKVQPIGEKRAKALEKQLRDDGMNLDFYLTHFGVVNAADLTELQQSYIMVDVNEKKKKQKK